jgi:hypothetical protein
MVSSGFQIFDFTLIIFEIAAVVRAALRGLLDVDGNDGERSDSPPHR